MGIFDIFRKKEKKRNYKASQYTRLINDFVTNSKPEDEILKSSLQTLRDRARNLARNNPYARKFIQVYVVNTIGANGVTLQNRAKDDSGAFDRGANTIIENRFKDWGNGSPTVDGKLNWIACQRLLAETYARDGEVLVRLVKNYNNDYGFALEFMDSDYLDHKLNRAKSKDKNEIVMGVEKDSFGKPINYYLFKDHPNKNGFNTHSTDDYNIIPAEEIIHFYNHQFPNQTRGVPPLTPAMTNLKMLDGYLEAELVASRVSASKMGFFTSSTGDEYLGEDTTNTNNMIMNAEAGTFEQLPQGVDFKTFDPQHPSSAFTDFTKTVLRSIACSLGVSYNSLASDLESVNYSSLRQGALEERDFYHLEQSRIISMFHTKVFSTWLDMALLKGALSGSSGVPLPASKYLKFNRPVWFPRSFTWIDPLKEVQAQKEAIQMGFISMQDVASNYGRDVETLFESIQREKELAKEYDIQIQFEPFGARANNNEEKENDEQNS